MKILQILGAPRGWGGAERVALDLAEGLRSRGHDVAFVGEAPDQLDRVRASGFEVTQTSLRGPRVASTIAGLALRLHRDRVDIVHMHGRRSGIVGLPTAFLAGQCATILHIHNVASPGGRRSAYQASIALLAAGADKTVCCAEQVRKALGSTASRRAMVIPNGVPFPDAMPDRAGLSNQPVLLAVGSLTKQKAYPTLLRAFCRVRAEFPEARLRIAGDGELAGELRSLATELLLDDSVEFLGFRNDIAALHASSDLFVMSSDWEGLPIALLEAMASGLPVVATAVGAIPDVVEPGTSGALVPPANPEALAAEIIRLLRNPDGIRALARTAFDHGKKLHSVDAMSSAFENLYIQTILAKRA